MLTEILQSQYTVTYLAIYAALLLAYISVVIYLARKAAKGDDAPADDMTIPARRKSKPSVSGVNPCARFTNPADWLPWAFARSWACRS